MKTLLLLRHAKSSWAEAGVSDHDRPLNDRGKRDAPQVGRLLRERDLLPDCVLSSTAKRARKTAAKVLAAAELAENFELVPEFYLAPPTVYIEKLRTLPDSCQRVLVVGHNPGMEELLSAFTGEETSMPTAAIAQIEFEIEAWSELQLTSPARLVWFARPSAE